MASFEEISEIIAEILGIETKNVNLNFSFDRLGTTSLDMTEIFIKIEDLFDIEIPEEDEHLFKTVLDLFHYVNQRADHRNSLE
jgi:acyl carrier protein